MKKNNWIILILSLLYSFLFYDVKDGLNYFLFCLVAITLLLWSNKDLLKRSLFFLLSLTNLLSSFIICLYESDLAVIASTLSFFGLLLSSTESARTLPLQFLQGLQSIFSKPIFAFIRLLNGKAGWPVAKWSVTVTYFAVTIVIVLFFGLYQQANPLFESYTHLIDFSWLTVGRIFFTLFTLFVLNGIVNLRQSKRLYHLEDFLLEDHHLSSKMDRKSVHAILFLVLIMNVLLLFLNALDLNFLYFGAPLPNGLAHKLFVHKGVNHLVFSILLGIVVILYCDYVKIFETKSGKLFRFLVYLWIGQNLVMIFSTAYRNELYIIEALLTYKRIAVFFWLLFCVGILLSTFYKLKSVLSIWKMIHINCVMALLILTGSSLMDWDLFISRYNIKHTSNFATLDKNYLLSLSSSNLKDLYLISEKQGFEVDSSYHYQLWYYKQSTKLSQLNDKMLNFLSTHHYDDWRSFNFRKKQIFKDIQELHNAGYFDTLDLRSSYYHYLNELSAFKRVKKIKATYLLDSVEIVQLNRIPNITELELNYQDSSETKFLTRLVYIKHIQINEISPAGLRKVKQAVPRIQFN